MYQESSPAAIQKALCWLNKQDQNWPKYLKDSNMAVKMYLKSHKKEKRPSPFQKKLEKLCDTNFGVRLQKPNEKQAPLTKSLPALSPPLESSAESSGSSPEKPHLNPASSKDFESVLISKDQAPLQTNTKSEPKKSVKLDSISLQILEEIKKEWNLKSDEEALSLLLQAGKKNLNRL